MKRQTWRKLLLWLSFLLFPLTLYYFSPYLIIQGALEGIITGSFILFALQFTGAIVLGRLFCGWICPAGGLQEGLENINGAPFRGTWQKVIKYVLWALWIGAIAFVSYIAGGYKAVDPLYQTWFGISVSSPSGFIIYYGVILLILSTALGLGKRGFCHTVCWMAPFMVLGIQLRKALRLPGLHLQTEPTECIKCGQCNKACEMTLPVQTLVSKGKLDHHDCILCGKCVDICPKSVLSYRVFSKATNRIE